MTVTAENLPTFLHDVGALADRQITVGNTYDRTHRLVDQLDAAISLTGWTFTASIFDTDPDNPLAEATAVSGGADGSFRVLFTATHTTAAGVGVHNYRVHGIKTGALVWDILCGKFILQDCNKVGL